MLVGVSAAPPKAGRQHLQFLPVLDMIGLGKSR
jgi:hypothetical protein